MHDTFNDDNQLDLPPTTKLLNDDQERCHFVDNNLEKIFYHHTHPINNRTECSINQLNSMNSINCSSSIQLSNSNYQRDNSSTLSQLASLINSNKEGELNSLKLNQAISIPTINYFSSNNNIPTSLLTNSTSLINTTTNTNPTKTTLSNQQQQSTILPNATNNTLNSLNGNNTVYQESIELQSNVKLQPTYETSLSKSNHLNSCSGSCNQLIHGYYQMPKGQQTLFNNNIYTTSTNQNRNRASFAALSSTNGLPSFNRFNLLRNSMRSTNELISNTIPSSIYGQFNGQFTTMSSLRNSLAWSPIYWSNGINNFNNLNNVNNVKNLNNKTNGDLVNSKLNTSIVNCKLTDKNRNENCLPVCSTANNKHITQSRHLSATPLTPLTSQTVQMDENRTAKMNQTISNHEISLDDSCNLNNSFNLKQDQSIDSSDKISLYDNVDDECLQPLLKKTANLLDHQNSIATRSSSGHVRLLDNCRDDVHSLSLNKLCL